MTNHARTTLLVLLALMAIIFRAGAAQAQTITVKGSDTMVILGQRWAEQYMRKYPQSAVQVTGGGSGTGISALINGTTDICQSSREMKQSEKEKLRDRYATTGVELPVATDGLSIYVHESNPINEISFEQLRQVFLGKLTNWKQLGGADAPIVVYGRENSSGTYVFFKDTVLLGKDFGARTQTLPGTAAVVNAVSHERNGIGYGGAAYAKRIKVLRVRAENSGSAYAPNRENVLSGVYPLARPLFFYLRQQPRGEIKRFVDFVLSAEGQAIVNEVGYFPVQARK